MNVARLIPVCGLLLLAADVSAQAPSSLRDAGDVPLRLAGSDDPAETRVYICLLYTSDAADE